MKRIYLIVLALLGIARYVQAQLIVQNGTTIKIIGNTTIGLKDIDLVNNGFIDQPVGGGKFVFSGSADNTVSGSSITTFDRVEIAKATGKKLLLIQSFLVNSSILFTSGLIDLNDRLLQLKPGAILSGESENSRIMSSSNGYLYTTVVLNAPSVVNPGNIGVTITSSQILGSTTIRRRHLSQNMPTGQNSISRYYEIYPTNNTSLNATLRLAYLDAELNGQNENVLALWKNAGTWSHQGFTSRNTIVNYVEKQGISSFSPWTLAAPATSPAPAILTGDQGEQQQEIQVYPSPATVFLIVKAQMPISNIKLLDLAGRKLIDQSFAGSSSTETLKLKQLKQGVYIIQGRNLKGASQTRKVIIAQ